MSYKTAQNNQVVNSIATILPINNIIPTFGAIVPDAVFKTTYNINKNSYPIKTIPALDILSNKSFRFSSMIPAPSYFKYI
jgi:hypothetical protein